MKAAKGLLIFSIFALFFAQAAFAAGKSGGGESASFICSKIIQAYGGKLAIEKTSAVYAIGDIDAFMRGDSGTYEMYFKRPRKLRVNTRYQRSSETRILNGESGYRGGDGALLEKVEDYRLLSMVYQYKHFDLPYGLLRGAYTVILQGKTVLNGKPASVLHLTDKEGPPMDVYVDGEFHIVKVTGYFDLAQGATAALTSEFSDFRKVGGAVFPFKIDYSSGEMKIAETVMKSYKINPPIPDSLFAPGN